MIWGRGRASIERAGQSPIFIRSTGRTWSSVKNPGEAPLRRGDQILFIGIAAQAIVLAVPYLRQEAASVPLPPGPTASGDASDATHAGHGFRCANGPRRPRYHAGRPIPKHEPATTARASCGP